MAEVAPPQAPPAASYSAPPESDATTDHSPSYSTVPDLPPCYAVASATSPAPLYSERPSTAERVLHAGRHPTGTGLAPPPPDGLKHVYKTDHLEVRLHPPHWGLALPAFGLGGTVEGLITFRKQCSHVLELSVSLQGVINTCASQHATVAVPGVSRLVILKKKVVLFTAAGGDGNSHNKGRAAATLKGDFPFAIQFPATIDGRADPLPPSYTVYQPGITTEIAYTFRVDIVRKGLRRHEKLAVPTLYLPKSRPTRPPVEELPWAHTDTLSQAARMHTVLLEPTWSPRVDEAARRRDDLPSITLTMPDTRCFASGDTIAVALRISSARSPALARLLSHNAHLALVKRQKTWISLGAQISVREVALSRAERYLADASAEGTAYLRLEVQAGEAAREASWRVEDAVAVEHILRLVISPPEHLPDFPVYRHDVQLKITTDQYGSLQNEALALGGVPFPALGLNDVQRYLRPSH